MKDTLKGGFFLAKTMQLVVYGDKVIKCYDFLTKKELYSYDHQENISNILLVPNTTQLIISGESGKIACCDVLKKEQPCIVNFGQPIFRITPIPETTRLLVQTYNEKNGKSSNEKNGKSSLGDCKDVNKVMCFDYTGKEAPRTFVHAEPVQNVNVDGKCNVLVRGKTKISRWNLDKDPEISCEHADFCQLVLTSENPVEVIEGSSEYALLNALPEKVQERIGDKVVIGGKTLGQHKEYKKLLRQEDLLNRIKNCKEGLKIIVGSEDDKVFLSLSREIQDDCFHKGFPRTKGPWYTYPKVRFIDKPEDDCVQ